MVLNFLQDEMKIVVVTQYIPGGMKQMKRNYGKYGKLDYRIPNSDFIFGSSTVDSTTRKSYQIWRDNTLSPHDFRQMEGIFG